MRFAPSDEQRDFAAALDALLRGAGTAAVVRAWTDGDLAPGKALWRRVADLGVTGLLVPEHAGGLGAGAVELVLAFEALGRYAVPGPWVEHAAYLPHVLEGDALTDLAAGTMTTIARRDFDGDRSSLALDADAAERVLLLHVLMFQGSVGTGPGIALSPGLVGDPVASVDPARRLHEVGPRSDAEAAGPDDVHIEQERVDTGFDHAALATAAQILGAGERLLADAVSYVRQRRQFGREIGSFQSVKHQLADVRIQLDFARPLLWGGALSVQAGATYHRRDVSAAKVACTEAATLAARVALQVHGAIGYTRECDLSLWLLKVRALRGAWGTLESHRDRVLDQLDEYDDFDTRWSVGVAT